MNKVRVLLADDHSILRSGLIRLLTESDGIEVIGEAETGNEAIQKVQELSPDIVLMDIGMPEMNGMEATRLIKKQNDDVKVLILTVHDDEEYIFQAFKAGATGYVLKKAACNDLVNAINVVARGEFFLYPSVTRTVMENYLHKLKPGKESSRSNHDSLTDREREILKLIAEGYINREIAEILIISVKTVETHKANIMDKLGLHKRADLVHYAINQGLLQVGAEEVKEPETARF